MKNKKAFSKFIQLVAPLKKIGVIAGITFLELVRERILWSAFFFALICVGLAYSVSQLSFAESPRIALDFGLASVSIVGGLISIILGSSLIAKEVEHRTVYLLLTKALSRWQFVIGKVMGLTGVVVLNAVLMSIIVLIVFFISGGAAKDLFAHGAVIKCFLLQWSEFAVLAAVSALFSSFSTVAFSAIVTSGIWVIGHAMTDLQIVVGKVEPAAFRHVLEVLTGILPDLTRFDVKAQVSHGLPIMTSYTVLTIFYAIMFIFFALSIGCMIFSRRDL